MFAPEDGPEQTRATGDTVMRYHLCWKHRDLDGVMALYHPGVVYHDFFQNRVMGFTQLRDYVQASMPRAADEALEHSDRIRLEATRHSFSTASPCEVATGWCHSGPAKPSRCVTV